MATQPPSPENEPQSSASDRLDSWKEIASYLKREIRTVQRWEASEKLPVHRHLHRKQGSVYAFKSEIDQWWRNHEPQAGEAEAPQPPALVSGGLNFDASLGLASAIDAVPVPAVRVSTIHARSVRRGIRPVRWAILFGVFLTFSVTIAFLGRQFGADSPARRLADVALTDGRLVAFRADGTIAWDHYFTKAPFAKQASSVVPRGVCSDDETGILVTLYWNPATDDEVDCFTRSGNLAWTFSLNDQYLFGTQHFGPPWHFFSGDVVPSVSGPRVAVAFHHDLWWPGAVVLLDSQGHALQRFVNSGWILQVRPQQTSRGLVLLAGGITNSRDAAFMAVLNPDALDGTSPEDLGSDFQCRDCPAGHPIKYFVFPRSEVNLATGSAYSSAGTEQIADSIIFRTYETVPGGKYRPAEGIFTISPQLKVLTATYGDTYWDVHRELEIAGVITHDRAHCPDRNGPRLVREWDERNGWKDIHLNPVPGH